MCFYLQDKSLPVVLLTLCSLLQLSAAPPLSVAADDKRHLNHFLQRFDYLPVFHMRWNL